ncbi:Protein NSP-INTERACTING KINASE 3 [Vigna angularis]|uniref:Protein NSP-INTERACTING KINASE 3 n=1 Tax=Phaseolus angularis TaxID=3914 RepID=A0A8T0JM99_PHAAN|nr:Protein NSP-INTERACTING KINASE 3 [Vigna angularis]
MELSSLVFWLLGLLLLQLMEISSAALSPSGINYEVVALMAIKGDLTDPHNVLENWDSSSVDPCSWRMVTCSSDGSVSALGFPSQNLSGTLSPGIGNLTNLQSVLLQNNAISGRIPAAIGNLERLHTLDLSNNAFSGEIPSSLGGLKNLNYFFSSENKGQIQSFDFYLKDSYVNSYDLNMYRDLSYNNLSGSLPRISARTLKIVGNPLICGPKANNCSSVLPEPLSFPPDALRGQSDSGKKSHHVALAFGASFGAAFVIVIIVGFLVWWRYRRNQQIFFDVNAGGEIQFQTEVETISLAVHRNLLRLSGFCSTQHERLLVYPYMSNGSVASRLKGHKALDFGRAANQKGVMLDWVKKLHQDGRLSQMVDKDLKGNFDLIELEEMVQVALLCTQFNPSHRPKMSEVLKMLEGDGLAERWEASQRIETPRFRSCEPQRYSDLIEESSLIIEAMELSGPR